MSISKHKLEKIEKIVKDHLNVIRFLLIGGTPPPPKVLKQLGIEQDRDLIEYAYLYGRLLIEQGKDLQSKPDVEIANMLKDMKVTQANQRCVDLAKMRIDQQIKSLTQRITTDVVSRAVVSDLEMYTAIAEEVEDLVNGKLSRQRLMQELREKTKDYTRDWHRVAQTEMWTARNYGEVQAILEGKSPFTDKGINTNIYIRPSDICCKKCAELYLESDGVTPKVFKLSTLIKNGNNYGKKQAEWKAVIPPLHPNCQCLMNVKPDDTDFENGELVYKPKNNKKGD